MIDRLRTDVRTARQTDPAAQTTVEVLLYAGLWAVWWHRLAHWAYERGHRLTGRALAQFARFLTGVEIHPAAELGQRVFVDHGMGVVIGETAEVGDDVTMYHGVTLGGDDPHPVKRHPTVENGATLGARSTIVGDVTIGEGATVGAGAVVVEDVPPGATVAGNPARRVDDDAAGPSEADDSRSASDERGANSERRGGERGADTGTHATAETPPVCCE
jgi:serine O-acetyltransferase